MMIRSRDSKQMVGLNRSEHALNSTRKLDVVLVFTVALLGALSARPPGAQASTAASTSSSIERFLGRWDLTVAIPTHERPSWIEFSEHEGRLEGLMVGLWGHATPTGEVRTEHGEFRLAVPDDEGFPEGTIFEGRLAGSELVGTATAPDGASWRWSGRRAPTLDRKSPRLWGKPIRLFDGKDLAGWTFVDPTQAAAWSVEDGMLVKHGRGSEIVTTSRYRDFKLHIEFKCGPMANSGVYLRGRYEVQIETNAAQEPPNRRSGAVYGFLTPKPALTRTPEIWQSYDITLIGRTVSVVHDGRTIIDRREIPGITGGALDSDEGSPGPIYLQGTEDGQVQFRNIVITPAR
jgi:3-keto-disaccharide hydrolase